MSTAKNATINADLSHYKRVLAASGAASFDVGDRVARMLRRKDLNEIYKIAADTLGESVRSLRKRYGHLNPGMVRMNLGNRIRAASAKPKRGAK